MRILLPYMQPDSPKKFILFTCRGLPGLLDAGEGRMQLLLFGHNSKISPVQVFSNPDLAGKPAL